MIDIRTPTPTFEEKRFTGEKTIEKALPEWKTFLVTEEPDDTVPLIEFYNAVICTSGNHSLILGKKKSRKTLFIVWLISQYLGDSETDILIVDTEQGLKHVWKTRDRIYRLTGKYVNVLALRGLSTEKRRDVIEQAINDNEFKIVFIDGIRDLLSNINDPDQCTALVTWIEALTLRGLHVCNILHLNKTDNNARGHIGSELLNKAEITIELENDDKANCTTVKCESSRDTPFEAFAFTHNEEGLPEVVSVPIKGQSLSEHDQKERLQFIFDNEQLKRSEVIEGIKNHFGVGISKSDRMLATFLRLGWIVKSGKDRSPDTVYKLMTTVLKPTNRVNP